MMLIRDVQAFFRVSILNYIIVSHGGEEDPLQERRPLSRGEFLQYVNPSARSSPNRKQASPRSTKSRIMKSEEDMADDQPAVEFYEEGNDQII